MSKHRSPNCPQIPFAEAAEKGRRVYEKETTHAANKSVIAEDLGYSGLNGRSLTLIGALRQYGILEGSGEALRVSKDAIAFYEMDDGPEKTEAIKRMAFAPDLFSELAQTYKDNPPSDGNLRHSLVNKGFSSKAADDVIRVYRANLELVSGEEMSYAARDHFGEAVKTMFTPSPSMPKSNVNPLIQTYSFALSPDARAELSLKGTITTDDLDLLRDHIELTIKALTRTVKSEAIDK